MHFGMFSSSLASPDISSPSLFLQPKTSPDIVKYSWEAKSHLVVNQHAKAHTGTFGKTENGILISCRESKKKAVFELSSKIYLFSKYTEHLPDVKY